MTDEPVDRTLSCGKFQRELYHFQAGELSEDERLAVAGHAQKCECCAQLLDCETELLRGLQSRLTRTSAPAELRAAIRDSIGREGGASQWLQWLRAPWLIPAAGAVALALLLVPALARIGSGVIPVDREVLLVDLACDRAGRTYEQQRGCTNPQHLNAFKVGPSKYWTIGLDPQSDSGPVVDHEARGHRLHVVGKLYTRIQALHLTRYTDIGVVQVSERGRPVVVHTAQALSEP